MSINERLDELRRREAAAQAGGGAERQQQQHSEGKLSARERIDPLLDKDAGIS
jgi:acetyl-CoA carboxylase carboxyltransferase component